MFLLCPWLFLLRGAAWGEGGAKILGLHEGEAETMEASFEGGVIPPLVRVEVSP